MREQADVTKVYIAVIDIINHEEFIKRYISHTTDNSYMY